MSLTFKAATAGLIAVWSSRIVIDLQGWTTMISSSASLDEKLGQKAGSEI